MKVRDIIVDVEFYETPLCPAGHLPLKGGDQQFLGLANSATLEIGETSDDSQSPS